MGYKTWHDIGHPFDQPLTTRCISSSPRNNQNNSLSVNGIRIHNAENLPSGALIEVCTKVQEKELCFRGILLANSEDGSSDALVVFDDHNEAFKARMTEQLCHITSYQNQQHQVGRELTDQEAAQEWIEKYSPMFPMIETIAPLH
jgi:hypothetical protein